MTILTEDRFRVRTHLGVNMVVEAGAGTGKTTLLIDRLCFALLAQGIAAPRLVALTFTEKAGAEIKTRLINKLQAVLRALRTEQPEETLQVLLEHFAISKEVIWQRAEAALNQLDRSPIGTIHSFCSEILRSYPLEAGLPPNADIDSGPRAKGIFEEEWYRFLDQELGLQSTRAAKWKEILPHITLNDLCQCARQMCSGKIEQYDYFSQKEKIMLVCQESAKQAQYLSQAFLEGKKKPRALELALQQAQRRFLQAAHWLQTQELPEEEKTISVGSVPTNWEQESVEKARALLRFSAAVDPFVQQRILTAYQLLAPLVQKVRGRCKAEGILSFDDLIIKTRSLLKNNLQVRRKLQESFDVFFIDEFQDTDPAQGELLLFLAEEKGNGATTWQEVKLEKGKLFVVGDPKQSIYRFRGADITAYELFTDLILKQGGEKAYLRQNFRSEREIVALANDVCSVVMVEKPAFQPFYEPIFTAKQDLSAAAELVLIKKSEDLSADDYRENQARFIACWIEENVGKMSLRDGRKLSYKDIVLLFSSRTQLTPYIHALRRSNIAFSIEEDRDFYHRQEVNDLLNLLRCINDPEDKIALAGVMRSPLGALTDEELYQAYKRREQDYRMPSENEKVEQLFSQLRYFSACAGKTPLPQFLRELLEKTFLSEVSCIAYDGERSIATLEKIVSLAEGHSLEKPATLGQFLSRIDELMQQELSWLTALSEKEATDAVNIMTVHKSKGLEFPVVILADISKQEASSNKKSDHLYSWQYDLHGLRVGKYPDMNLAWLEEEQILHAQCEQVRLLYVALTRAREKIIVVGNEKSETKTTACMFMKAGRFPQEDQKETILGLEDGLRVRYETPRNPATFIYQQKTDILSPENKLLLQHWPSAYEKRQTQYQQHLQQILPQNPSDLADGRLQDQDAMDLGTAIHTALAHIWQQKKGVEDAIYCACMSLDRADLIFPAQNILKPYVQSDLFDTLRSMKTWGVEMPFFQRLEQGTLRGVIDLLLEDDKGLLWVIDYKTDQISEENLIQSAQKYAAQLSAYKQAVEALYPSKIVKSAVIFVRNMKMIEL